MTENTPIKVLVVDDSALIRSLLSEIVKSEPGLLLVGAAADAYKAKEMVNEFSPDVITLDVEMPEVDGLTFLEKLMKAKPTAVLMVSSFTEQGADITLRALELGAVDFIAKPKIDIVKGIEEYRDEIVEKIKQVATAKVGRKKTAAIKPLSALKFNTHEKLIAIGASTGGTEAIKEVLKSLPTDCSGIVITQHMPPGFTNSFSKRLDSMCQIKVKEAEDGDFVLPGNAYLAPGGVHLTIVNENSAFRIKLQNGDKVSGHKPSVDVMFSSVAKAAGKNAIAIVLTGMGKDGSSGITEIASQGGYTIAQDEETSLIFGMPNSAIKTGKIKMVLPLQEISSHFIEMLNLR